MKDDREDLKAMRLEADVPVMDIAQDLSLHWQTVYRVLDGKGGRNSTKRVRKYLLERRPKTAS